MPDRVLIVDDLLATDPGDALSDAVALAQRRIDERRQ